MSKLLDEILDFLSSATPEQLQDNWKKLEPYENIGPNAGEFVKFCLGNIYSFSKEINNTVIINSKENPEYCSGFFI
jgi:hypothetical protein